jgi:drug/metabolite transporter (DMT)-like permease
LLSALLFGLMAWMTRAATQRGATASQVAFIRFAVASLGLGVLLAGFRVRLSARRWDLLVLRGTLGSAAALCYFIVLARLPAGTTTLLHYSAPIWSTIIAAHVLDERPSRGTIMALACASVGVVLVVLGSGRHLGGGWAWLGLGVASSIISGGAGVAIRAARKYNSAWTVFAVFSTMGAIFTAPPAIWGWRAITSDVWLLCLGVGVVSGFAQMLMTHALGAVDNASAGILGQVTVLAAMVLGYAIDREIISDLSALGALLTVGGIILAARVGRLT